jgi:DNA-binding transcriptional ArsR family regulator
MDARRDVYQGIADPTRREIIHLIAGQRKTLNQIAENFTISRPAISQHVKILIECGLVEVTREGRERYCEAKLRKLDEVISWAEQYRKFWTSKLDALESFLDATKTKQKKRTHDKKSRKSNKGK